MSTLNTENKIKITELIMVFIATLPMGIANILITKSQNDERLAFERQNAQSILSIQNKELFMLQNIAERAFSANISICTESITIRKQKHDAPDSSGFIISICSAITC